MEIVITKQIAKIIRNKPSHFRGTKKEWSKLIRSLIIPPDPHSTWLQDKNTGEWVRVKN